MTICNIADIRDSVINEVERPVLSMLCLICTEPW